MTEILAPAGNKDCALSAINNGANAIYLGYCAFSARQGADNFTEDTLKEIVEMTFLKYHLVQPADSAAREAAQ